MDPLVRTASFQVKPEMLHEAEEVVRQFVAAVKDNEPGTRLYVSLQDKDDPTKFLHLMIFEDDCGEDDHSATTWVSRVHRRPGALPRRRPEHGRVRRGRQHRLSRTRRPAATAGAARPRRRPAGRRRSGGRRRRRRHRTSRCPAGAPSRCAARPRTGRNRGW